MKFAKLKNKILKRQFDKAVQKLSKNSVASNKEIRSVGILTADEISSKIDIQKEVEDILDLRNSKMYSYRKYDNSNKHSYKYFSENDINWKGQFIEPSIQNFLEQPFDLLIGYYPKNKLHLENATLQSKATFKAGFSNVNPLLFNLEISEDLQNVQSFCSELKKYLTILNKLKN